MATVTLTDHFNNLSGWQGDLLWANGSTTVTSTSAVGEHLKNLSLSA